MYVAAYSPLPRGLSSPFIRYHRQASLTLLQPSAYSASWSCPRFMYSAAFDFTYLSSFRVSSLIRRKSLFPHWAGNLLLSFHQRSCHPLLVGVSRASCAHILVAHSELYNHFLYITVRGCVAVRNDALGKASWVGYAQMAKMVLYGMKDFTTST
jgi:hypothetical protein